MKQSLHTHLPLISKLSKAFAVATLLLSNTVLAESYQSFSSISYSHKSFSNNSPEYNYYFNDDSNDISLSSQYYFEERLALGPLNEFDYINTISNVSVSVGNNQSETFSSYKPQGYSSRESSWDDNDNTVSIGGQWITNDFIFGGSYSYRKSSGEGYFNSSGVTDNYNHNYSYDDSSNYFSLSLGYLFSDNFVIQANILDDDDGSSGLVTFNASYNWQLADTDYIGFSYNVNDDFDFHQLSTSYFFGFAEQSYLVLGAEYYYYNPEHFSSFNSWGINASYYYNDSTSLSASYDEEERYSVSTNYFFNKNYSLSAGYNSVADNRLLDKLEGYFVSFSAQF